MKRILALIVVLSAAFCFSVALNFKVAPISVKASDETPEPSNFPPAPIFSAYDKNGMFLSSRDFSDDEMASHYDPDGIIVSENVYVGTYGSLAVETDTTAVFFHVDFAPAYEHGLSLSELNYTDVVNPEDDNVVGSLGGSAWYFGSVGIYKVTYQFAVFDTDGWDGETPPGDIETNDPFYFYFICKSTAADFTAVFTWNDDVTYTDYDDFSGEILLNFAAGNTYQSPEGSELTISALDADETPFRYQQNGTVLSITVDKKPKDGTYQLSFKVSYYMYDIGDNGEYLGLTGKEDIVSAVIVLEARPHTTNALDVLLGIGLLAALGGVIYGVEHMISRINDKKRD